MKVTPKDTSIPTIEEYQKRPPSPDRVSGGKRSRGGCCNNESERPLVSIITVVRNCERYLGNTIQSVLSQDYDNYEYIIIDGASTDGTLDIIRKYEEELDLWISEPDEGIYDAMNKGIALAQGSIIKLINADDLLVPGSISNAAQLFQTKTAGENHVVCGKMDLIDEHNEIIGYSGAEKATTFWPVAMQPHPTWYIPKKIHEINGLYLSKYKIAADREMFFRLKHNGIDFFPLNKTLVQFRYNGASSSLHAALDSFFIHKKYIGIAYATLMFLKHAFDKLSLGLLLGTIGEKNVNKMRKLRNRAKNIS